VRVTRTVAAACALLLAGSQAAVADARGGPSAGPAESARAVSMEGSVEGAGGASAVNAEVDPADLRFQPRRLRPGTPERADLLAAPLARMGEDLRSFLEPSPDHPMYAGGVVLAARHGVVPVHEAAGKAVRYADAETELPEDEQVDMETDTIVDLASVTKTFTTIAVLQQVEDGRVDLDAPVATYLPDFAQNGKADITIRDLLTHTAGLPAWQPLYSEYDTVEERFAAVLAAEPVAPRGEEYIYSDLGLITLGLVVEEVTGSGLDTVIAERITDPLGMDDTMFNPPESLHHRIAATEAQPWAGRPMIRGEVHDENAWSLGGVAGHAGLFSTAHDLAVLAQTLLGGGRYGGERILEADTVRAMLVNENAEFPGDAHGLGFELDQRWYMDALSSPVTFGHTGYTGTSVVIDPLSDSFVILLTNRVHPSRDWGSNNPSRRAMARHLARVIAVPPAQGQQAWFSGIGDERSATLTALLPEQSAGPTDIGFRLWYDTEASYDVATFELSTDGGQSWQPVPYTLRSRAEEQTTDGTVSGFGGRTWHRATATVDLPADGEAQLRWRYDSDTLYQGRGVYVDAVRVDHRPMADTDFVADGWEPSEN
jgi:CubicO group peptidase (beta-lactamase class C family)